jgi:L-amino acid N-acyltransferase YncA
MGVLPEHRSKGYDLLMYYEMMKVLRRKGYQWVDCGWILESNQDMAGTLKGFGMKVHRTYRLYEKQLS